MKLSDENDIGYPSFESKDNDARYVPEYDYILQFEKTRRPTLTSNPYSGPNHSHTCSPANRSPDGYTL